MTTYDSLIGQVQIIIAEAEDERTRAFWTRKLATLHEIKGRVEDAAIGGKS